MDCFYSRADFILGLYIFHYSNSINTLLGFQGQNLKDLKNLILSSNCSALLGTVKSLIEPLIAELYSDDRQGLSRESTLQFFLIDLIFSLFFFR